MVDDRVEHVLREMEVRGITVIRGGDEAEHHLWSVRARAAYLPVDGEPGVVITGTCTTYADALHEAYHSSQHEARNWRAWDSAERVTLEIETHQYMLNHARDWSLSPEEIAENRRLLEYWERQIL
ncbi:MAG TPA: hypothetical protein VNM48_18745 [Chloroflexota bacterium]|jgi:hypothetical protein|nr:hypothetical protein [Chloroflexota bacterium]